MAEDTETTAPAPAETPPSPATPVSPPPAAEAPAPGSNVSTFKQGQPLDPAGEQPVVTAVNTEAVAAQVAPPAAPAPPTAPVHEVSVTSDHVITDPSSPLAVQVPEKADNDGLTPLARAHAAFDHAVETVEQVFARERDKD